MSSIPLLNYYYTSSMTFPSLFTNLTPQHATRHTFSHPAFTSGPWLHS